MKVLLILDSSSLRDLVQEQLLCIDAETMIEAVNGPVTLSRLVEEDFNLVVCGWNPPTLDGLSYLRMVRRMDATLPVLLIVGASQRPRMAEAVRAGCSDYLIAPLPVELLREKLEKWVGAPV